MISLRLYLDARAAKKGEPCPIKLMLNHRSKTALLSLGVSVLPSQWDARSQLVVNIPSRDSINAYLLERRSTVQNMILRMTSSGELIGLSVTEVKRKIEAALSPDIDASSLFVSRFKDFISRCKANRTREIYQVTLAKVKAFDPHYSSLRFEAITKDWLSKFEVFLSESGCKSVNARAIHLRNIRAVFNDAIDNGITSWYPFRSFKVKSEATKKRAVSVEALRSLFSFPGLTWQQQYVDAFKLSFCLVGINLVDLLALKDGQLVDGRLSYRRSKTGRLYDIKVEPEAAALIEKYHGSCGRLVSWGENRKRYTSFTMQMCRGLKAVGSVVKEWRTDDLGVYREVEVFRPAFPMLSSYVARHSWATIASSLDIPKDVIAHALGHGGSSVTDIYIDFDQRKVDEANRRVLDWVFYGTK